MDSIVTKNRGNRFVPVSTPGFLDTSVRETGSCDTAKIIPVQETHMTNPVRVGRLSSLYHFAKLVQPLSLLFTPRRHRLTAAQIPLSLENMAQTSNTPSVLEQAHEAVTFLRNHLPSSLQAPRIAIICGSGLGGLANTIDSEPRADFDYTSIPNFPHLTVAGHAGKLVFGSLNGQVPTVLMVGRAHYYEGHTIDRVTFPIRVFKLLGIHAIILTNAAGGLNPDYMVGDIVLLNDHVFLPGLGGIHPLRGPNAEEFGPRFPPLSDAYDLDLRRQVHKAWATLDISGNRSLHEGVYAFVGGPSYETRAECRMLHRIGADLVGMSTVPEIVVARHCGIRVLAFSLVTNRAVLDPVPRGDNDLLDGKEARELGAIMQEGKADHQEVLDAGHSAAIDMQRLVMKTVALGLS
ncbi:purine-nucleoside phosphorylase [Aspergillus homomorphus CBS 101889]|uniref:purine-nucleoside phosphorylase n=1 Tax=Aspergillus homomorphus (strain CBS 101889) TaxID=1450537 RepID=A0A395HLV3_ASPHC|nr:inosine guanosine and [Aspergillus homomorphus CBS 101889]RAL08403.1 inosine guanosine and [Aspergillus homomorphus CBS 101889]